jgi:predicted nuclease of predicted toxin-antitoxin system
VRLLLDAHLSPVRIGEPLRALGHDVLAIASDVRLARFSDRSLMQFANEQRRIMVTCDGVHFDLLAREWASTRREHAGLIIVWSLRNRQFHEIVDGIRLLTAVRSRPRDWKNLVLTL